MFHKLIKLLAMFFVFFVLTVSAHAAEITFYEYEGFGGRSLTLRAYTPNFSDIGFNDRAASLVVKSGTWQVCTDADFKGTCATLTRGEYRSLDSKLRSQISAARETAENEGNTGTYSNYGRGSIELFEKRGFAGASVVLDRNARNFELIQFNDRAGSIIVREGTWELCVDQDFRGACRTFTPGRYTDIGYGMEGEISSARMVGGYNDAPFVIGGSGANSRIGTGVRSKPLQIESIPSRVLMYDNDNFRGRSMTLSESLYDFANSGFDNLAQSLIVEGTPWEFCTDPAFRGECKIVEPGRYNRLTWPISRSISSARPAKIDPAWAQTVTSRVDVELFENDNFEGRRFQTSRQVEDLNKENFNDITSSIVIYNGQWEMCVDANFQGRCVVFGPGRYPSLRGFNDLISSLRRLDR